MAHFMERLVVGEGLQLGWAPLSSDFCHVGLIIRAHAGSRALQAHVIGPDKGPKLRLVIADHSASGHVPISEPSPARAIGHLVQVWVT